MKKEFVTALDDDLNISRVLSSLFALVGEFNGDLDRGKLGHAAAAAIGSRLAELDEVLGIMNQPQAAAAPDAEIDAQVLGPGRGPEAPGLDRRRSDQKATGRPGHRPHRHPRRPALAAGIRRGAGRKTVGEGLRADGPYPSPTPPPQSP